MLELGNHISTISMKKKKKVLQLLAVSFILLLAAIIGIIAGISSHKNSGDENSPAHTILKSSCSISRYPDLCYSAIATVPGAIDNLKTQEDVIEMSLNITRTAVEQNYFTIEKLITTKKKTLTERETTALHDCLEMVDDTLDELHKTAVDFSKYGNTKKTISQHANDLKTLLSGAMANQESCLDGFSHDEADKEVRSVLEADQVHVFKMCSNALAMIKNMTDTHMVEREERQLMMEREFPKWLFVMADVTADVTVAVDGSGNYTTVTAAVEAAPEKSSKRYVIWIKAGVYRENVEVSKKKKNIMFVGDGRKNTIITSDRNVVDGSTTFHSATVAIAGEGFLARDITFQNTAGPSKHQAVALRVGADQSAFYRCDILAYQDTLYVHSLRQFYVECLITGTVDFIFGNAAAVFQNCDIHARKPDSGQKNMVTAHGRKDPNQNTGIVIQNCRIDCTSDLQLEKSEFSTYLGRPWKEYSRTIVMQSSISDVIHPSGWHEWEGDFALNTSFYAEYRNTGAGADTANRVKWKAYSVLTNATQVQPFTVSEFLAGNSWLRSTGFPFTLSLE
ncbi:hypothetical protein NE237_018466 [Protea cynaroides]|uniref:Pectinesterase n=1 Tax=Protea cynaroides TaxID=273540 RepID=A0A9Q0KA00_9MAGN|nr:hypothetical protein NE237_018466 [Protea cynaroides]